LGHNGAGKTTALNLLIGHHKPSSGTILLENLDILSDLDEIRLKLGVCHQHDLLFDDLSVEEHLILIAKLKLIPSTHLKRRVDQVLDEVSLDKSRHTITSKLSGGTKRRLSIAMGIVAESRVLIMDEPTTGLDPIVRDQIWSLIKTLKRGRCIVMTTQHLEEAEELADGLGMLETGKLVA